MNDANVGKYFAVSPEQTPAFIGIWASTSNDNYVLFLVIGEDGEQTGQVVRTRTANYREVKRKVIFE